MNQLLQEVKQTVKSQDIAKAELTLDVFEPLPAIRADRHRLSYVFWEISINALKQLRCREGERLLRVKTRPIVDADEAIEGIRIEFMDTGGGVKPEDKKRIFDRGFKARKGGTGIGLFIVKRYVEEHGGTVEEVGRYGEGAHFVITLPVSGSREGRRNGESPGR